MPDQQELCQAVNRRIAMGLGVAAVVVGGIVATLTVMGGAGAANAPNLSFGDGKIPNLPLNDVRGVPKLSESVAFLEDAAAMFPDVVSGPFHLARTQGHTEAHNVVAFCFGVCPQVTENVAQNLGSGASLTRADVPSVASIQSLSGQSSARASRHEILLDALHHAREAPGLRLLLEFAHQLLIGWHTGHPDIQALLLTTGVWIVPSVNPDGYITNLKVLEADSTKIDLAMARKNKHMVDSIQSNCIDNAGNSYGVDLNRNYDVSWKQGKLLDPDWSRPCSEAYPGESPGSEREVRGIKALVKARNFSVAINLHTFGKSINAPYASSASDTKDVAKYATGQNKLLIDSIAAGMAGAIAKRDSDVWEWGPAVAMVQYSASGEAGDWMLDEGHVIAFAPELGPKFLSSGPPCSAANGHVGDLYAPCFWQPADSVADTMQEAIPLIWYVSHASGPLIDLQAELKQIDNSLSNDCSVRELDLSVRNAGASSPAGDTFVVWGSGSTLGHGTAQAWLTVKDNELSDGGFGEARDWIKSGLVASLTPGTSPGRKLREESLRQAMAESNQHTKRLLLEAKNVDSARDAMDWINLHKVVPRLTAAADSAPTRIVSRLVTLGGKHNTSIAAPALNRPHSFVAIDSNSLDDSGNRFSEDDTMTLGVLQLDVAQVARSAPTARVSARYSSSTQHQDCPVAANSNSTTAVIAASDTGFVAVVLAAEQSCVVRDIDLLFTATGAAAAPSSVITVRLHAARSELCAMLLASVNEYKHPSPATYRRWGDTTRGGAGPSPVASPSHTAPPSAISSGPAAVSPDAASPQPAPDAAVTVAPTPSIGSAAWTTESVTTVTSSFALVAGGCCLCIGMAVGMQMRRCGCVELAGPDTVSRRNGFQRVQTHDDDEGDESPTLTATPSTGAAAPAVTVGSGKRRAVKTKPASVGTKSRRKQKRKPNKPELTAVKPDQAGSAADEAAARADIV